MTRNVDKLVGDVCGEADCTNVGMPPSMTAINFGKLAGHDRTLLPHCEAAYSAPAPAPAPAITAAPAPAAAAPAAAPPPPPPPPAPPATTAAAAISAPVSASAPAPGLDGGAAAKASAHSGDKRRPSDANVAAATLNMIMQASTALVIFLISFF